jgi:hypothetical protein
MRQRTPLLLLILILLVSTPVLGQCPTNSSTNLIDLIPNHLRLTPGSTSNLAFLNEAIGSQVSDLPLATPASGVIYTFDPKNNVSVPSNETLGPILTQRAETIGRHKIYVAFTYQYFQFEDIDSVGLKNVPIKLATPDGQSVTPTNNRIDLKANQFTGYFTFGLTDSVDVSVAVPIININERITTSGVEYGFLPDGRVGTGIINNCSSAGAATGVGDVNLSVKAWLWKIHRHGGQSGGLSVGGELRLPTGDSSNFLGAGTVGFRPFVVFTYGGRFSPHGNLAYEVNGNTNLVTNSLGYYQQLPSRLIYSGGADWGITKRLTIAGDVIAQRVFDAQRVALTTYTVGLIVPPVTYQTIVPVNNASYTRVDGAFGFKLKPFSSSSFLITGNLLVKLNQGGLRTRLAPLGGLSITF